MARARIVVTGTPTTFERMADSGNRVARAFCGTCGSPVLSTNTALPDVVFVRASSLDDPEQFTPGMNVYASRAPSWARLDRSLATFAEMPPPDERPTQVR